MIRVNLLARRRLKKKFQFQLTQTLAVGCSLILVLTALVVPDVRK